MTRILRTFAIAGLAMSLVGGGTVSLALAQQGEAAVAERINAMKSLGKANLVIKNYVEKDQGSPAAVVAAAMQIASVAEKIPTLFPKGTDEKSAAGAKSRAKADIWEKWPAFEKGAASLKTGAMMVADAGKAGDKDKIKSAFAAMGKNCGGCHKPFRGPEKK